MFHLILLITPFIIGIITLAIIRIIETIDTARRKVVAKEVLQNLKEYLPQIAVLTFSAESNKNDDTNKQKILKLQKLNSDCTVQQLADLLSLAQLKRTLTYDRQYFSEWVLFCNRLCELNNKYPLAIYPLMHGRIVFDRNRQPTFNKEDIFTFPKTTVEKLVATPISKYELAQIVNNNLKIFDYTLDTCAFHSNYIKELPISSLRPEEAILRQSEPFSKFQFEHKTDCFEFAYHLKIKAHHCFYHFTDKSNLKSIIEHGGLYAWSALDELGITSKKGGNDLSHNLDCKKGLQNYVRLAITPFHPMQYRLANDLNYDLVTLEIHPIVALFKDTLFSDMNATDKNSIVGGELKHFCSVSRVCGLIYKRTDSNFKQQQSEILIKRHLPLKYILNIHDLINNDNTNTKLAIIQMNLEEYKREALDYHQKRYPNCTEERESLRKMTDKEWEEYMEDSFTPQELIVGLSMGLL